jgi:Ras-related C3 botulinum toxin substrate 1
MSILGTKSDLRQSQNDCITRKEAKKMKSKIKAVKYLECSAMSYEGLDSVFMEALRASITKPKKNCFTWPFPLCK